MHTGFEEPEGGCYLTPTQLPIKWITKFFIQG